MNQRSRRLWSTLILALCAILFVACGDPTATTSTSSSTTTAPAAGAATTAPAAGAATTAPAGSATTAAGGAGSATTAAGGASSATTAAGGAMMSPSAMAAMSPSAMAGTAGTSAAGTTPSATTGGAVSPVACTDAAQGAQVTMWSPLTGPDGDTMTALAKRFNQENGKSITITHLPQQDYITKLGTAVASNTLPDMTVIRGEDIATQAARNVLRPIPADVQQAIGVTQNDFPPNIWAQGQYKNQRYTIPLDVHPIIMYYNKSLLQQAGISDAPKTSADLEAAAAKLNANGVYGWSVTTGVFPTQFLFQTLLHQYGGSEFNADGTQATFNSDAGVKALTYLRDAQSKYAKVNLPQDAGVTAFKQGKSAIEMNGIWQTSSLVTGFPNGAAAPIPQWGSTYAVWASTHELAFTNQKNPDAKKTAAAACWISWLSANSADWSKAGNIPVRNAVRTGGAFQANAALAPVAPEADAAFFQPNIPGIGDALAPMADAVNAITAGTQSNIKQALDNAVQKANQTLQQNKQRYGG